LRLLGFIFTSLLLFVVCLFSWQFIVLSKNIFTLHFAKIF
jgi:hypothetical protein